MFSITRSASANGSTGVAIRRAAVALTVACAAMFASGCGLLSSSLERAAKGAGKVVTYYCENVTIPEIREQVRAAVNQHAAPHSVAVECADGGEVLRSGEGETITAPQPGEAAPSPDAPTAWKDDYTGEPVARSPIIIISKDGKPKPKPVAA